MKIASVCLDISLPPCHGITDMKKTNKIPAEPRICPDVGTVSIFFPDGIIWN
jgi:hypothetical protein